MFFSTERISCAIFFVLTEGVCLSMTLNEAKERVGQKIIRHSFATNNVSLILRKKQCEILTSGIHSIGIGFLLRSSLRPFLIPSQKSKMLKSIRLKSSPSADQSKLTSSKKVRPLGQP